MEQFVPPTEEEILKAQREGQFKVKKFDYHPTQKEIMEALEEGYDSVAFMPTGLMKHHNILEMFIYNFLPKGWQDKALSMLWRAIERQEKKYGRRKP